MKKIPRLPNLPPPTNVFGKEVQMATWYECPKCLNQSPLTREWVGLPDEKEIIEMSKDAWGRSLLSYGRDDHCSFYVAFARAVETYLKEKNDG